MLFAVALLAGASLKEQPPYAPEFFTEAMLRAGNELKNGEFVSPDFVQLLNKHASLSATCSAVGDCGRAYQACCVAFGAKGYPCGCHLQASALSGTHLISLTHELLVYASIVPPACSLALTHVTG